MRRAAIALGVLAVTAGQAATAQAADQYTIRATSSQVQAIGAFEPGADPSPAAAAQVFGPPSSSKRLGDTSCRLGWRNIGLRIVFTDFGGGNDPCGADGKAQVVSAFGKVWNTFKGLKVGQSTKRLRKLYPKAKRRGSTYRLLSAPALEGGGSIARASATSRGGKVTSFKLFVGAAGT